MKTELMEEILDLTKRSAKPERVNWLMECFDKFVTEFIEMHTKLFQQSDTRATITYLLKEMFPTLPPDDIEKVATYIWKVNYGNRENEKFVEIIQELYKLNEEQITTLMNPSTRKELYIALYSPERLMFMFLEKEIKYERDFKIRSILTRAENTICINKLCSLLLAYYKTRYELIKKYDPFTKFNIIPSDYTSTKEFVESFSDQFKTLLKCHVIELTEMKEIDTIRLDTDAYKLTKIISKYIYEDFHLIKEIIKIILLNEI